MPIQSNNTTTSMRTLAFVLTVGLMSFFASGFVQAQTSRRTNLATSYTTDKFQYDSRASDVDASNDFSRILVTNRSREAVIWNGETAESIAHYQGFDKIAITPDGTRIVGVMRDDRKNSYQDIALIQPIGGTKAQDIRIPLGEAFNCHGIQVSGSGRRAIVWNYNREALVIDLKSGEKISLLKVKLDDIQCVSFDSSGRHVFFGSKDGTSNMVAYDVESGEHVFTAPRERSHITAITCARDNDLVAVSSGGSVIRIYAWQDQELQLKRTIPLRDSWGKELAFTNDGKQIAYALNSSVTITNVDSGESNSFLPARFAGFTLSGDGSMLLTVSDLGNGFLTRVWNLDNNVSQFTQPSQQINTKASVAGDLLFTFVDAGKRLAVQYYQGVFEYDPTSGQELRSFKKMADKKIKAFPLTGEWLVEERERNQDATLSFMDPQHLSTKPFLKLPTKDRGSYACTPNGDLIAVSMQSNVAVLKKDRSVVAKIATGEKSPSRSIQLSNDGKRIAVKMSSAIVAYDVATQQELARTEGSSGLYSFSADSQFLFSVNGNLVSRQSLVSGEQEYAFSYHSAPDFLLQPTQIKAAHTSQLVAIGNQAGDVYLWHAQTGNLLAKISTKLGSVQRIAFDPSDSTLAVMHYASSGSVITTWDISAVVEKSKNDKPLLIASVAVEKSRSVKMIDQAVKITLKDGHTVQLTPSSPVAEDDLPDLLYEALDQLRKQH